MEAARDYLETKVKTASPEVLVLIVYEGALKFLRQAEYSLTRGNYPAAVRASVRVQKIMAELTKALDPAKAPELAENLEKLYDYVSGRTAEAVAKRDPEALKVPLKITEELYDAWKRTILANSSGTQCCSAGR